MGVVIISVCDKEDDRTIILKETSLKLGYELIFLGTDEPWISNTYRLKLILNYLNENINDSIIYLIVDAFDVGITGSASEAIEKFQILQSDMVFSGESNYALWEKRLRNYYWNYYPNKFISDYPFLNAGTIMGKGEALRAYLKLIFSLYELEIDNIDSMKRIKSDQYLITRFYVDYLFGAIDFPFKVKLDDKQFLLGCTGGRTCIFEWPIWSKKQDYRFFYFERRFVKLFKIKNSQNLIRDFYFDRNNGRIVHKKSGQKPILLHIPGSLSEFPNIWKSLHENHRKRSLKFSHFIVSLLAFLRSAIDTLIAFPIQLIKQKSLTNHACAPNMNDAFRFKKEIDLIFQHEFYFERISKTKQQSILPFLPYFISKLKKEKFVIYTAQKHLEIWNLLGFNDSNCIPIENLNLNKELKILICDDKKINLDQLKQRNGVCIIFPKIESYIEMPNTIWRYFPKEMPISL